MKSITKEETVLFINITPNFYSFLSNQSRILFLIKYITQKYILCGINEIRKNIIYL